MKLFKIIQTSFNNFDSSVRDYLSKTFGNLGLDYTHNQIFGVIFDGIKGVMQNVMFYIEDAFTEQNIYTATRKKSFYSLAKISGYEPYYGSAATGNIIINTFVTNDNVGNGTSKLFLQNGSIIKNKETGYNYTVMLPSDSYVFDLSKPLVQHNLKIVQGIWSEGNFTGIGYNFETFSAETNDLFDKNYLEVYVNGEKFEQAACVYDMTENSKQFVCNVGFDNTCCIMFGNEIFGYRIHEGDSIKIRFIVHAGEEGNIINISSPDWTIVSPLYNSYGNPLSADNYLNIKLATPVSGGTHSDSLKLVQDMIGYNSRSLVLANENNFKQFLKRFSFIGQTSIISEPNSLTIVASCLRNKTNEITEPEEYLELESKDLLITDREKEMVITALSNSNNTFTGMSFEFQDPIICKFAMICYVKIASTYNKELTKTKIRNAVALYFMGLPENTQFISKSDIINTVTDADSNIESFDFDFISELNENAYRDGYYIEYKQRIINGVYKHIPTKIIYDKANTPGIDQMGNIQLTSKLQIPLLHGEFYYYPNKESNDKSTIIKTESIQVMFI